MATFSNELKDEICLLNIDNQENALSELSAIIKSCGEIRLKQNKWLVVLSTEYDGLLNRVNKLLYLIYKTKATQQVVNEFNRERKEIIFPLDLSEKILVDTEVMFYDEDKSLCLNSGISDYIIQDEEQMREYLKGVVLGCFTSNIIFNEDKGKSTGYHVEFVFSGEEMALDFSELLSQFEIISKKIERKNQHVVYIKDFEQICLLLEVLQVPKTYLKLKNENTMREVRNQINRQNNCFIGNSTKTVNASVKQLEAIKIIDSVIGIEKLEEPLQRVCYLRMANPEESLDNLVKLSLEPITKSGLNHRLQKIIKIASELK